MVPLYAVLLPRCYCWKISIQGAALHKVGPQTCAAPCCCIKWRLAYCGAMGLCHPFFQGVILWYCPLCEGLSESRVQ